MSDSTKQFISNLYKMIYDLDRYHSTNKTKEILSIYHKLNISKVFVRCYTCLQNYKSDIKNNNEKIFEKDIEILPGINLSEFWQYLKIQQKKKIWVYLNVLMLSCDIILSEDKTNNSKVKNNDTKESESTETSNINFNPYVGVGNNKSDYSMDDMMAGPEVLKLSDDKESKSIIPNNLTSALTTSMLGNNMLNIGKIKDELKNMKQEDIDAATDSIKKLLGDGIDDQTSELLKDILQNITQELQNDKNNSVNSVNDLMKFADNIAKKIGPKMEKSGIDTRKILESTKKISSQFKNEKGESMFGDKNPFDMLDKLMGPLMSNENNKSEISEDKYIETCNDALKNLGINNDVRSFDPNMLTNMFNMFNK